MYLVSVGFVMYLVSVGLFPRSTFFNWGVGGRAYCGISTILFVYNYVFISFCQAKSKIDY